jgi:hypothetical protein
MAGPYDYTVNIPQPPANNFLQSLLGIQQLKGLQQQSEISAQQAAIQQQQAQFAQERQPYELAQMRAAEKSALASAASSKAATDAKSYELTQRKALDAELLGISSDPSKFTPDNIQKIALRFHNVDPTLLTRAGEMRKNIPDQAKIFGDNVAKNLILTSVTGDAETAIKQLDKSLEAANNTPELKSFVPQLEELKNSFINYPDQTVALAAVGQTFFSPDQGKAITDVMAEQAKIGKAKAETTGEKTKSELQEAQARLARADAALKELKATGKLDSEEGMKQENVMRGEFRSDPVVRNFQSRKQSFNDIQNAEDSVAGDRARIVAFIKLQQPDSVVSVTESGQIEAPTASQKAKAFMKRLTDNGLLGDSARKELESQANSIFNTSDREYKILKKNTEKIANNYGINAKNIVELFDDTEAKQEKPVSGKSAEEERMRSLLRPAAGFGNTLTPSTIQPQGTAVGISPEVQSLINKYR